MKTKHQTKADLLREVRILRQRNARFEKKLRSGEERYATLLEQSPVGIFLVDARGKIVSLNRQAAEIFGYARRELRGKGIEFLVPDRLRESHVRHRARYGGAPQKRPMGTGEILYGRKKDGSEFPVEITLSPLPGDGGPTTMAMIADISDRVASEEALRKSEMQFRTVFEKAPLGIALAGADDRIINANEALCRMLGYTRTELCSKHVSEIVHPDELSSFRGLSAAVRGTSTGYSTERRYIRKDGSVMSAFVTTARVEDPGGRFLYGIGLIKDISERKEQERRIRESEELYRNLVESAPVGVFQVTRQGGVVYANESLLRIMEYDSFGEIALLDAWSVYRNPLDRENALEQLQRTGKLLHYEVEILTKKGTTKRLFAQATLTGNFISGMVVDLTESRRMEADLRSAEKRLRRLSHRLLEIQEAEHRRLARELHDEIGQILTAAKIDLQVIRKENLLNGIGARLDENVAMMDRCLQQVRTMSLELRPSVLDDLGIEAALRWQLDRMQQRAGFASTLSTHGLTGRLGAHVETACFRIAQEALTNIAKHSGARHVGVALRVTGPAVRLTVTDDGTGFDVKRVLNDASLGESFGVLGMQERAALLGGSIRFHSREGFGSIVDATIPLVNDVHGT